jgi:hypothetical protein
MPRKVFYSFHFDGDCWRTQTVRNINAIEGNKPCSANEWEEVKKKGDANIENWISDNMSGRSCVIVLVGEKTANRKWVKHEIAKGWNDKKGVLGIRIHRLLDSNSQSSTAGENPFDYVTLGASKKLSSVASLKNPAGSDSKAVYATIKDNIETWIEEAIKIRADYKG